MLAEIFRSPEQFLFLSSRDIGSTLEMRKRMEMDVLGRVRQVPEDIQLCITYIGAKIMGRPRICSHTLGNI